MDAGLSEIKEAMREEYTDAAIEIMKAYDAAVGMGDTSIITRVTGVTMERLKVARHMGVTGQDIVRLAVARQLVDMGILAPAEICRVYRPRPLDIVLLYLLHTQGPIQRRQFKQMGIIARAPLRRLTLLKLAKIDGDVVKLTELGTWTAACLTYSTQLIEAIKRYLEVAKNRYALHRSKTVGTS